MKYTISYMNRNLERKTATRTADSAWDAAEKIANQFGWGIEYNMVDADTRGQVWGSGLFKIYDQKDGTAYVVRSYTSRKEC